jgi:DNA-binding beta-propeller fold protein YncE
MLVCSHRPLSSLLVVVQNLDGPALLRRRIIMRRWLFALLVVLHSVADARAQRVVLVAGGGDNEEGAQATESHLNSPFGVDFDAAGNLYFVEIDGHRVCRIDKSGILVRIAGTGKKGDRGDGGPPLAAEFNALHNLAIAANGDIYLADTLNSRVRKIDAKTGLISTIAGSEKGFGGDGGPATKAQFSGIYCASLDPSSERLYLADLDNRRIRMVDLKTGIVSTVAGNGARGVPADGAQASAAPLVDPRAVAADRFGNVYVLERSGNALRIVTSAGEIRTIVGTGQKGLGGDGASAREATLNGPKHLCVDHDGGIIIADTENHVIRKYSSADGRIVRLAGSGKRGTGGVGGPALEVELNQPHGVFVHPSGDVYISDSSNHRILKIERGR